MISHPIQRESLFDKIILKLHRLSSYKILNWYRLGDIQQAWYLKKLFKLFEIDLVIDAGGNLGQYATFLRKKVGYRGKILTIEPMVFAADSMRKKFKNDNHWQLEQCAISDTNGEAVFHVLNGHQMSSLLKPSSEVSDVLVGYQTVTDLPTVQVKTLDSIFSNHVFCQSAKNIYLKLDIQGKELAALQGCKNNLHKIVALQAELNVIPIYEGLQKYHDLMREIENLGYVLSFLPAHAYRLFPDMVDFDAHFIRRSNMVEKGYLKDEKY